MKLFQQLLVAPAALGLMAPMAANAADLDIKGVSDYSGSSDQVTSISRFQDVYPTDWAYQALSSLIERYGCVAGYPSGSYLGIRVITRFEAAALLNACLDRITEVTDELRRLLIEFEQELAILKGRVDGLEARVGELEATQFSTTTKLFGQTTFVFGGNHYGGDGEQLNGITRADAASKESGGTTFTYDMRLDLNTSFTGKDLLKMRLRAGNFSKSAFGSDGYVGLHAMEVAFQEPDETDIVAVNRLYYSFPIGESFTVIGGPIVRQDDMLAIWPSAYPVDTILDIFTYAGSPATYNRALGGGAGIWWEQNNWSISANYVSENAYEANPNTGGVGTDGAASSGTVQIAYAPENWGIAAAYNYASGDNGAGIYPGSGTYLAHTLSGYGNINSLALSAWWSPEDTGWMPSISTGWGYSRIDLKDGFSIGENYFSFESAVTQSWYIGLQWDDVFVEGNTLGMAVGQPTFVTNVDYKNGSDFVADGQYAWEFWYAMQITDNITVTPAIFYLSRQAGEVTNAEGRQVLWGGYRKHNKTFNNFGALLKTTFRF